MHHFWRVIQLKLIKYTDSYKAEYTRIYNECYHEMRESLDIKPYDYIQSDSFFGHGMDDTYLLIDDDGGLIGGVAIKGNEIDDLFVIIEFQGRNYGREILLWALTRIEVTNITLHVAAWNTKAISLYEKLGFRIVERIEF